MVLFLRLCPSISAAFRPSTFLPFFPVFPKPHKLMSLPLCTVPFEIDSWNPPSSFSCGPLPLSSPFLLRNSRLPPSIVLGVLKVLPSFGRKLCLPRFRAQGLFLVSLRVRGWKIVGLVSPLPKHFFGSTRFPPPAKKINAPLFFI